MIDERTAVRGLASLVIGYLSLRTDDETDRLMLFQGYRQGMA